jgi:hypothetical protein
LGICARDDCNETEDGLHRENDRVRKCIKEIKDRFLTIGEVGYKYEKRIIVV